MLHRERKVQRQIRPIIGTWHLRRVSEAENHVTATKRRVENAMQLIIFLPNVAVGKTITQDKDVRLFHNGVDEKEFKT